jgi:hypothetical protein
MPYNFVVCKGLHQEIITNFFGVEVSFDENQVELLLAREWGLSRILGA